MSPAPSWPARRFCMVRRQSPDWSALSDEAFARQSRQFYRMLGRPEEQGIETARLWDRTFATSFCQTRQAMKDIATANLRGVQGALLLASPAELPAEADDQTLCYFVDDDDWVRPDGFQILAGLVAPEYDGYVWRQIRCGRYEGSWLQAAVQPDVCGTNNYAVSAGFLRRDPANWERVYQHFAANEVFPSLRVRVADGVAISATNRHPASTMFLERGLHGDFSSGRLAALIDEYNRRLATPLDPPPDAAAAWVLPWVEKVRQFYRQLAYDRRD